MEMGDTLEARIENISSCQRKLDLITAELQRKRQHEERPEKWYVVSVNIEITGSLLIESVSLLVCEGGAPRGVLLLFTGSIFVSVR